jgi:hypothetical protein
VAEVVDEDLRDHCWGVPPPSIQAGRGRRSTGGLLGTATGEGSRRREPHHLEAVSRPEVGSPCGMGGGAAASKRPEGEVGAAGRPTSQSNCGRGFLAAGGLEIRRP